MVCDKNDSYTALWDWFENSWVLICELVHEIVYSDGALDVFLDVYSVQLRWHLYSDQVS
jgi:hypothetical protein